MASIVDWQISIPDDGALLLLFVVLCLAPLPLSQIREAAGVSFAFAPSAVRGCACARGTSGVGCRPVEMLATSGVSACCWRSRLSPSAGPSHRLAQLKKRSFHALLPNLVDCVLSNAVLSLQL